VLPIDVCINNAIIGVGRSNAYAQTKGERRSFGRPTQASFEVVGSRLLS
jgi:hypothetical protein